MKGYPRYISLVLVLAISCLYCFYFFNGYLGLSDGNDYAGLARSIVRGEGLSLGHLYPLAFSFDNRIPRPDNIWAPAYPVYLAIWFLIFGQGDTSILAAIIFSVWLFIVAAYVLARKIVGEKWALLAAALIGLNQSVLATSLEGSPEPLTAALFLFSLYFLISKKSNTGIIVSGILFGLTVLSRYQMIILIIPVMLFLFPRKLKQILIWLGTTAIILSPWLIRNYIQFGNPFFTLQAYGEFTKGMGHLNYYYYTYRSFTPMSFWYAFTEFPFYVFKKFAAGVLFFSWWTVVVMNFSGAIPFVFAVIRMKFLETIERRFAAFTITSLFILIALSSFDGIHLRHLVNIQGALAIALVIGLIQLKRELRFKGSKYIGIAAVILLLLPYRFPALEMELKGNKARIENDKEVYEIIKKATPPDAVIVSDASDGVWWYCDRSSIWVPVLYSDLKTLTEITRVDYIYLENTTEFVGRLNNEELLDFLTSFSIVDGSSFGWSLYEADGYLSGERE
jgi:4-amino-4-deoxy-L-arabinose transferase-like glycosyltransferase